MPRLNPERPRFANGAEQQVWQRLCDQLRPSDHVLSGVRITDHAKDHEADNIVLIPGAGVVVIEVKGGSVWHDGTHWRQHRGGQDVIIDPTAQVRATKYALRSYVDSDPRWRDADNRRTRWAHAIVLPHTTLPPDFELPDTPRWSIIDASQLDHLAEHLNNIIDQQETNNPRLTHHDADLIADILRGRGTAQRDLIAQAEERASEAQRLTQEQAVILGAIQLLHRVEIRGGAGSGKTWLAIEQARRLTRTGQRVALICYSRGLAAYLRRHISTLPRKEQPAYVGEFHRLGHQWGATPGPEDDPDYWENRLPEQMTTLAHHLPTGQKYDAIIIDEAQDFADSWWPSLLAALKDPDTGGLYAYSDEGQRVFARYGQPPVPLVPLILDHNLRNTRQIAATFNTLAPMRMRLFGGDGPDVQLIECPTDQALDTADDHVDHLIGQGWRPQDIALLTTGSRHVEQVQRQAQGQDSYWQTFWDDDQVFYGHVLGFKGLERRAVVLALNETTPVQRSRERLYVGLSRARDQLVVCGDPELIRQIAGDDVLRKLRHHTRPPTP
jgi:hypothetical protein